MDCSQSSDFFGDNTDCSNSTEMDTMSYETLVSNVKTALHTGVGKETEKPRFLYHFTTLLNDCCECVSQSLDIIFNMLCEPNVEISKLAEYMMDTATILQMLSNYIKTIIGTMSMSCCTLKTFPTTTGRMIMMVYTHCKDSESLYGATLPQVQIQLKQIFQACHELQVTYLMIIEKHFVFDLTVIEELDVLVQALDINLEIGEIVQTLDVKTMAEQWKAFTTICEKYASCLANGNIYYKCSKVLCVMVDNSIKSAVERDQDEKVVLRSLKVGSFTIKILLRMCNIFKNASMETFEHIVELLIHIFVINSSYQNSVCRKSAQFINLFNTNITNPTDCLLKELFFDDNFVNCIISYDIGIITQNDRLLGYIHIILGLVKSIIQRSNDQTTGIPKHKVIDCIYNFLPHCDIWFKTDYKFYTEAKSASSQGLYEALLCHACALCATMNSEEYSALEKTMIEAILNTECCKALFSSNLWVLLARMSDRHLLHVQLTSLCKIYQKMENNSLFNNSPQEVHLSNTINRLFGVVCNDDKVAIAKQFNLNDDRNLSLWSALKIGNLPEEVRCKAEEVIAERLKMQFHKLALQAPNGGEMDSLVKTMSLAATCSLSDNELMQCILKAWEKSCPRYNNLIIHAELDKGTLWYFQYVEALVSLTNSLQDFFHHQSAILVKVLHVISEIIAINNIELKLVLTPLIYKLALSDINDENKNIADSLLVRTFENLFRECSPVIRIKLYDILIKYKRNENLDKIISKVNDESLKDTWNYINVYGTLKPDEIWDGLMTVKESKYQHKCLIISSDSKCISALTCKNPNRSGNFDLADIDTLFENDSDPATPACKKVKLNCDEADIIARLENDAALLSKVKENISNEHVDRIRSVCQILQNIID